MVIELKEISIKEIDEYLKVPITLEIHRVLEVKLEDDGLKGIQLVEKELEESYIKDYDDDSDIEVLKDKFDTTNWGFFIASMEDENVGGVIIAYDTPGINMLSGRDDLAVVWDIRVHPKHRGIGIGHMLFQKAVDWSKERDCKLLKVETQNINVPACNFYVKEGCELGCIDRYAYSGDERLSHETMLIWYLELQ